MAEQSIQSDDMTLKRVFQDFYRVPDYQREYVWGETDPKGEKGDEVEQFLKDIHREFEAATKDTAPEYFIGSVVICPGVDDVYDLIDGQQRTTTAFLILCAIRDVLSEAGETAPQDLPSQIYASSTDWQGKTVHRVRLDLQYDDSRGVLSHYARGNWKLAPTQGTRSITNIFGAYTAIREFFSSQFKNDPNEVRRFYGYLTNKVKLIRIQTASVAKALKIFETINDRGVGLDSMDLLKNLLFMNASAADFGKLKTIWKSITDTIYRAGEKPLRFLRYFVLATFDVDVSLREDAIYDWFLNNEKQTNHVHEPLAFAEGLLDAAKAYAYFMSGMNVAGQREEGIVNTRHLGGSAVRQHYILLLAGRRLQLNLFGRLAREVEELMFVYMMTGTPTKDYERSIAEGARKLRGISGEKEFDTFCVHFFEAAKLRVSPKFDQVMGSLRSWDLRPTRLRYLLAKLTQHIDVCAYGAMGGHGCLSNYIEGKNDIEHILAENPCAEAVAEFGAQDLESGIQQRLGNLAFLEKTVNQLLGNKPYSKKASVYAQSLFLLVKCQAAKPQFGVADQITKAISLVPSFPNWNRQAIEDRQKYLAGLARQVWRMKS